MEPDCYQVEVLHFLNPHLIWIQVFPSPIHYPTGEFVFEQIGIFGILPLETTIDVVEECLQTKKSQEWAPGLVQVIHKLLQEAVEVWFSPVHIERRTSVFDNNIHKYGELIIKTRQNQYKKLSKILIKTNLAYYDQCEFYNELCAFNLKTKLDNNQTESVIKAIIKACNTKETKEWEKSVKRHTKVFHEAQKFENALTAENLERHNNNKVMKGKDLNEIIANKMKNFDLCKDVDDVSVGRGITKERLENNYSTGAVRKLELYKKVQEKQKSSKNFSPFEMFMETKKKLLQHAKYYEKITDDSDIKEVREHSNENDEGNTAVKECLVTALPENISDVERPAIPSTSFDFEENWGEYPRTQKKHKVKKSPAKRVIPNFDRNTEKLVAFGPPDINQMKLKLEVMPKISKTEEEIDEEVPQHDLKEEVTKDANILDGLDSEINIPITNKFKLIDVSNESQGLTHVNSGHQSTKHIHSSEIELNDNKKKSVLSIAFRKKIQHYKEMRALETSSSSSRTDTSCKDVSSTSDEVNKGRGNTKTKTDKNDSDDETLSIIVEKLNLKESTVKLEAKSKQLPVQEISKNHVNPFKNLDAGISKFVNKLVSFVLMVHSKSDKRIQPVNQLRDVNFTAHIHTALKNMSVKNPMTVQSISWFTILRGYSLFMVSPPNSGKTLGYTPAVCRLVSDFDATEMPDSVGPICIIVCATSKAVTEVERQCRQFLGPKKVVLSCFTGLDEMKITTSLLNGCDILISTPSILVRLLTIHDYGVDLRRLNTFVVDDCERLNEVYINEIKFFLIKIKEMLNNRANKELKVQYIVASRIWCDFMESLAKRAPKSVVCIGSFQECVLYSKSNMSVSLVNSENKLQSVLDFMKSVDTSNKRTVIVCRSDEEVDAIEELLKKHKYVVFAANHKMTVETLCNLNTSWAEYEEPVSGPILVCCDDNLNHLNVTDAHNLLQYSLPNLFSMFSRRFSVLVEHYPSIFKTDNETVKIKILLDSNNVEQLPKILNFVKRCTNDVPDKLDQIVKTILRNKDCNKAAGFVPICDSTLALGDCADFWNCHERHTVFNEFDTPKEWMPKSGIITFKILHYNSAVQYSVRLITHTHLRNGTTFKYPQTYSTLCTKMGLYYSKESNRQLHGIPQIGDICAVSIREHSFERCQVVKILTKYEKNGNPNFVLIKLIDEEKWEKTRDMYLYHLPDELKSFESHVALVRLAGVQPKDKDVEFSEVSCHYLKKFTDDDDNLYLRGRVVMSVNNSIIVDELEACQDLSSSRETVVRYDIKAELLKSHAIPNLDHLPKLKKLCEGTGLYIEATEMPSLIETKTIKKIPVSLRWAHLDNDDVQLGYFASAENPDKFFIRLVKFDECLDSLTKDIQKYILNAKPEPLIDIRTGDLVLAKFPDDSLYYRARIDKIENNNKAKCFFVDHGDWREVSKMFIFEIEDVFINKLPFQAIECRMIGLKPIGENWTEYSTNWLCDQCIVESSNDLKELYVKYFTKESAESTNGYKYGIVLIDTTTEIDIVINKLMLEHNLAQEDDEVCYLEDLSFTRKDDSRDPDINEDWTKEADLNPYPSYKRKIEDIEEINPIPQDVILGKPIRSVPLVGSDDDEVDDWDIEFGKEELKSIFKLSDINSKAVTNNLPAITSASLSETSEKTSPILRSNSSSKMGDFEIVSSPDRSKTMIQELDSDDFSSPENTQIVAPHNNITDEISEVKTVRKPKLVWRQTKTTITIRIELIGVEKYDLEIKERSVNFSTLVHDLDYEFELNLYGVVTPNKCLHESRGLYIFVKLTKLLPKNWLALTIDGGIKKWIVYDPDSINVSSEDEEQEMNEKKELYKKIVANKHFNDSSDDDEEDVGLVDDVTFRYKEDSD